MADMFVNASFSIVITPWESQILSDAVTATRFLADGPAPDDVSVFYNELGEAFRWTFPLKDQPPFTEFLAIFADPNHPSLDLTMLIENHGEELREVTITGEHFDPQPIAHLLSIACPSIRPYCFAYQGADIHGGQPAADGIVIVNRREICVAEGRLPVIEADIDPHLVALPTDDGPSLFWNADGHFGSLDQAIVYDATDAGILTLVDAPAALQWVALPVPVAP